MTSNDSSFSLYDVVLQTIANRSRVMTCTKATLVHISHVLENIVLENRLPALLFTGFQESSYWAKETRRYRELVGVARQVCIFAGKPLPDDSLARALQIELRPDDPLMQEWFLLILSPQFSVLLTGKDRGIDAKDEATREFDTLLAFEPVIIDRVCEKLVLALQTYRPDVVASLQEAIATYQHSYTPDANYLTQVMTEILAFELRLNRLVEESRAENAVITQALEQERQLKELIVDISPSMITMSDYDGTLITINNSVLDVLGISRDELVGHNPAKRFIPPEDYKRLIITLNQTFEVSDDLMIEYRIQTPNGMIDTEWHYRLVSDEDRRPLYVVGVGNDITLRKRAEQFQREQDTLRIALAKERDLANVRSNFMTTVSHEFRTPLSIILTSAELLTNYLERLTPEETQQKLERIRKQVLHLNNMVTDIMQIIEVDIHRPRLKPELLAMVAYMQTMVDDTQTAFNSTHLITFTYPQWQHTSVLADRDLLRRIVINLLSNAIKYSPSASLVHIDLSAQATGFTLTISDQGIGIPKEDQKRLFTPFYRGHNVNAIGGTGLGLRIVADSVNTYGGTLTYVTSPNGTTFTVMLPYLMEETPPEQ